MQKWRWFLRAALFTGNCVALIHLIQDAAQQLMHSADDDRAEAAMMMPHQNVMMDDDRQMPAAAALAVNTKKRRTGMLPYGRRAAGGGGKFIKGRRQQQQQLLPPDHVPHPMQRKVQNKKQRRGQADIDEADLLTSEHFTHYLIHIPKAGGTFARHQLNKDMRANKLVRKRGILCDQGVSPVTNYVNWPTFFDYKTRGLKGPGNEVPRTTKVRHQCSMYMTESHFSDVPKHVYSIIRDPREHLASAYFHCKESKQHGKKFGHLMPDTLDEWLNEWVKTKRVGGGLLKAQALKRMSGYRCYNPINMQSSLLLSPASPPNYGEESAPVPISKDTITERFDVLGLTSQMDKSLCLIFIRWNGIVPDRCNCNQNPEGKRKTLENNGGDSDGVSDNAEEGGGDTTGAAKPLTHHGAIHSHNVTNHGGTHEHTKEQLRAIEELADVDMKLYPLAEELFAEQVEEVERKFSVKLC